MECPSSGLVGGGEEIDGFGGEAWCCHGSLISLYCHSKLPIQLNQCWVSVSNGIDRVVSEGWGVSNMVWGRGTKNCMNLAKKCRVVTEATFSSTITPSLQGSTINHGFRFPQLWLELPKKSGVILFRLGGVVTELD